MQRTWIIAASVLLLACVGAGALESKRHFLIQLLPNGNRVVSPYHGKPQFFEVTREKKVVWIYHNDSFGNISGILYLDVNDDPATGAVFR